MQRHLEAEHVSKIRYLRQSQECSKVSKICSYFAVIYFYSFGRLQANSVVSRAAVDYVRQLKIGKEVGTRKISIIKTPRKYGNMLFSITAGLGTLIQERSAVYVIKEPIFTKE